MCLLMRGRRGKEGGGRKSSFIMGQDTASGSDEGCRLPMELLRPLHCHVSDSGALKCYCKNEQNQGCNRGAGSLHLA